MKKLDISIIKETTGGSWVDRLIRQKEKCYAGSARACRRYHRIRARHMGY